METLLKALCGIGEISEAAAALGTRDVPVAITGLAPIHRAEVTAALAYQTGNMPVMICAEENELSRMAEDLTTLLGEAPLVIPERDTTAHIGSVTSKEWLHRRTTALFTLATTRPSAVLVTARGLLQKTGQKTALKSLVISLAVGEQIDLAALPDRLVAAGYTRCEQVESVGQFAIRGGIVDVFSPGMASPVRCDFFDDELDALGTFDVLTQRRTENLPSCHLLPVTEGLTDTPTTLFDYFPKDAFFVMTESVRVGERMKGIWFQAKEDTEISLERGEHGYDATKDMISESEVWESLSSRPLCFMESLPTSRYPIPPKTLLGITVKQLSAYGGSLDLAAADLEQYLSLRMGVLLLCGNEVRAKNLHRILEERNIIAALDFDLKEMPRPGSARIAVGNLSAGSEYPSLKLAILTEGQMVAAHKGTKPTRAKKEKGKLLTYTDLTPGDLVVHVNYGIGRFVGMERIALDGVERDYIKIAYAGNDAVYISATNLDQVSKYIGGKGGGDTDRPVKLHKLGGTEWKKQKTKARAAAKDLAKGLIELYAARQKIKGFAFSPDSPWQQEFENAFDYVETDDQLRAVEEIKRDMERSIPMDRLLCGDVGYGKTEVALRAVMKCVLDGKQAAILVPTTVLAQQHFTTAVTRFRSFPVNIRVLSRFQTPGQTRKILQELREGTVDLLIGTHKLLQKDIQFKDLGLLIIDEEQRFGVSHKEKLKEITKTVDVLTLSATPIPRTLNMALSGIRDMSTIEEPPVDRKPVQTYVLEHDWGILADAMRREIERGGQVYYLHNRVEDIDAIAGRIRKMLGEEATVLVGHGKMNEQQMSSVLQQMIDNTAQVLVCTTIIETGVDIPNVNTIIIEDADHYGLSQLHQIRGRVGRSARRSYAYMTYKTGKILTEVAAKRLTAIKEYVEFGSGFKIAMRDLEIRGAGNLLGPEQSGYMMNVGYDMYLQLLEEAVLEEKGEKRPDTAICSADLIVNANIPEQYVPSSKDRMDLYRRIAAIRSKEESSDLFDELLDRYGDVPRSVELLLRIALLRANASAVGIKNISQQEETLRFTFHPQEIETVVKVCCLKGIKERVRLTSGDVPVVTLTLRPKEEPLSEAENFVETVTLHRKAEAT